MKLSTKPYQLTSIAMLRSNQILTIGLFVALFTSATFNHLSAADSGYGYPIEDPLAATIIGTPAAFAC